MEDENAEEQEKGEYSSGYNNNKIRKLTIFRDSARLLFEYDGTEYVINSPMLLNACINAYGNNTSVQSYSASTSRDQKNELSGITFGR